MNTAPPPSWQPVTILTTHVQGHTLCVLEQVSEADLSSTFIVTDEGIHVGRYALLVIATGIVHQRALAYLENREPA